MARLIKVMLIVSLVLVTLVTDVVEARSRVTKWLSSKGKRTVYIPTADGRVLKCKGNKCKIKSHAPVISKTPVNINPDEDDEAGKEGGDEAGGADDQEAEAGDADGGEEPPPAE